MFSPLPPAPLRFFHLHDLERDVGVNDEARDDFLNVRRLHQARDAHRFGERLFLDRQIVDFCEEEQVTARIVPGEVSFTPAQILSIRFCSARRRSGDNVR